MRTVPEMKAEALPGRPASSMGLAGSAARSMATNRGALPVRQAAGTRAPATEARPILTVAVVVERDGRYLFVEEETRAGLRLNQPAGHVEAGESIAGAAARETLEESAWEVDPVALVGVYHWEAFDRGATFVRFTFAATPLRHDPIRTLDTGIVRALWLSY
ncbi:MAG: NUDIX domain-containing protein, partial [Casimicrobiaceae bacterium]